LVEDEPVDDFDPPSEEDEEDGADGAGDGDDEPPPLDADDADDAGEAVPPSAELDAAAVLSVLDSESLLASCLPFGRLSVL